MKSEVDIMSFGKDFIWGAASASYQIEGAYNEDGKGLNIWDVGTRTSGRVLHNENGDVACDHYHRWKEDVAILKKLGIKNYRLSVSWTRILPDGTGKVSKEGVKFYSELIDELIENGITPYVTIFHWDYPYELYKKGGWLNDESPDWFLEYAKIVVDVLSDRVTNWFTINEPQIFVGMGYWTGLHAPFLKLGERDLVTITRNVMLAHGKVAKYIRENAKNNAKIGFAPIGPVFTPENESPEAIASAKEKTFNNDVFDMFSISWWCDPIVLGKFSDSANNYLKTHGLDDIFKEEDFKTICQPLDFFATNIYYSAASQPVIGYEEDSYQGSPRTSMEWPVTPEVLYWSPKFLYERYSLPIILSENGMANNDWVHLDGKVHDPARIDYMARYLNMLKKASNEVPVIGYFYWSIMDNFEWSLGYDKRFGLVYVDYRTQERIIKDSGYWYAEYIANAYNENDKK
jgi:beta-glucosidase